METLTTKQLFTIVQALASMRTRKEKISYEFTGMARKAYQDDIKHIDSILKVLKHVQDNLLASGIKPEEMHTTIEIKL